MIQNWMIAFVFALLLACGACTGKPTPAINSQHEEHHLLLADLAAVQPPSRVSVNIVDALWSYVGGTPNNASHGKETLASACSRGFTFVRFAAIPYWPSQMKEQYYQNTTSWWEKVDAFLRDAEAAGCQLMPTLWWNTFVFSDVAGEPFQAILHEGSKSRSLLFDFINSTVSHFARSRAVVAWELWNELNLLIDQSMQGSTFSCAPGMGTPASRTLADNSSTADLITLQRDMAAAIRAADPMHRPTSSGSSIPRADAEHLRGSYHDARRDQRPDSRAEFARNLADTNQFVDWISIHMYSHGDNMRWNYTDPIDAQLLREVAQVAASLHKPLYLGEFGDADVGPRSYSHNVLKVLAEPATAAHAPLSTIWVWEFYQASPTQPSDFSLVPGRDDEMISTMRVFNQRSG
jgi:hypothetical protein